MGSSPDDKTPNDGHEPDAGHSLLGRFIEERTKTRQMAPLLRELDERRIVALISDYRDELEGRDHKWLDDHGATIETADKGFAVRIGEHICCVEPGPGSTVLVDGMPFRPEPLFFTPKTYGQLRARLDGWAGPIRRR